MKNSDLYILNCKIQLIESLYGSVKLNANHYIPWEQNYDLVMPLDRDMVYGNGLSFEIQEKQAQAIIFDTNPVNITLKDSQQFDTQYFFGNMLVGVLNNPRPD